MKEQPLQTGAWARAQVFPQMVERLAAPVSGLRHENRYALEMNIRRVRALLQRHPKAVRRTARFGALALSLGLVFLVADPLFSGPLRTWAERSMNAHLKGYQTRIGRARLHLWRLGFDVDDLVLVQTAHPDPPVADIGALAFSLQWWELLRFRVAGNLTIRRPALHINLTQIKDEADSHVSLKDRGWQRAVESLFPFRLNQVKIQDGSLLYLAEGTEAKPLQFTHVDLVASNVRNIDAAPGAFPSPVMFSGQLFDTGKVSFQGTADFLRKPYAAVRGMVQLDHVPLDRFHPLAHFYQLRTQGGVLTAAGTVEATPEARSIHLSEIHVEDLRLDYLTSRPTQELERAHAQEAINLARKVRNAPHLLLQVDRLKVTHGEVGFINEKTVPPYRLFISQVALELTNMSNQANLGRSELHARGAFMGHGAAQVSADIHMAAVPADFDVRLEAEGARLADLNPLFNAAAGLDVAGGEASLYAQVTVKNGRLEGYLKPILKNVKVYDRAKDKGKPFRKRVEEHVLQVMTHVFKNRRSQDVATVIRLSGPTTAPRTSEWETLRRLLGNGFFRAILPGFQAPAKPVQPGRRPE